MASKSNTKKFGSKAETLEILEGGLKTAQVQPQVRATVSQWRAGARDVLKMVSDKAWGAHPLIVRSSAAVEDRDDGSMAGRFKSESGVKNELTLKLAIMKVIDSFGNAGSDDTNQFFIQPMVTDIAMAGVAFSRDPNTGGPYFVINYDDSGDSAEAVTSGKSNAVKTYVQHHQAPKGARAKGDLGKVIGLMTELEEIFGRDSLDAEFATTTDGVLYLLQARPLAIKGKQPIPTKEHAEVIGEIARKINLMNRPHPYLLGKRAVFGVMPDWNPAEIIGVRPKPLALSLYRELITDNIWAYQRDNYGYRNLRSFPLLIDFHGLPYIDVRVSFNSFIPKGIDHELAGRLVDYYLDRLRETPSLHDKVEFEIIFSCYTLDLPGRLAGLESYGFSGGDRRLLADSLRKLTNAIVSGGGAEGKSLWRADLDRISELEGRHKAMMGNNLDRVSRIYWLLEDCKRYGTLPFAGLARAGFIAVQMLRSMVSAKALEDEDYHAFMQSLNTVGSRMKRDLQTLGREEFLAVYGHLRPGAYDILSPRYDEAPELYFDWPKTPIKAVQETGSFCLAKAKEKRIGKLLSAHGLELTVPRLFEFLTAAIEGREWGKFVFTRSLSDALSLFQELGKKCGFSPEDCAHADISIIRDLFIGSRNPTQALGRNIETGYKRHGATQQLTLPHLIVEAEQPWAFHVDQSEPNYITQKCVIGHVAGVDSNARRLKDAIVMIPSADPGFDWVFSRRIRGFVTKFGGVNSHMAIRAGELGIPCVIGAGETLYDCWSKADLLQVDCSNCKVTVLK